MAELSDYEKLLNPGAGDFRSNVLSELKEHLSLNEMSEQELYVRCKAATQKILDEWQSHQINPTDTRQVTGFYEKTQGYCYELIGYEIDATAHRKKQLEEISQYLLQSGKLNGCDFGSGVGTFGIYLNRRGIHCDFADVSETNLSFISKRLKKRGLANAKTYQLTREELPNAQYDFITALDVLEHLPDPVQAIEMVSRKLKVGGYFIFNVIFHHEEEDQLHLLRDENLIRKSIRRFGFDKIGQIGEFKIYQLKNRPAWMKEAIYRFDVAFWEIRTRLRALVKKSG